MHWWTKAVSNRQISTSIIFIFFRYILIRKLAEDFTNTCGRKYYFTLVNIRINTFYRSFGHVAMCVQYSSQFMFVQRVHNDTQTSSQAVFLSVICQRPVSADLVNSFLDKQVHFANILLGLCLGLIFRWNHIQFIIFLLGDVRLVVISVGFKKEKPSHVR